MFHRKSVFGSRKLVPVGSCHRGGRRGSTRGKPSRCASRLLRFESLEDRCLLSSWPGLLIHDSSGDIFTVAFRDGWNLNRVGNTPVRLFDMAFSPTGQLYAVGGPAGSPSQLYTLTVNYTSYAPVDLQLVGTVRLGGSGVFVNALEFGPDGHLYAAGYDASGVNTVFRIDPSTAAATALLVLGGHRSAGDLEFDEFGNLFITTEGARLLRVDLNTRTYQDVGYIVYSDFFGLSYGPGPVLHAFRSNGDVYQIDTQNASLRYVTRLSHSLLDSVYGAAMIFPGPLNLGPVDYAHRPSEPIVLEEMWYRVQTVRDAIFTVESYGGSSGTKITLYQRQSDGTLRELADVFRRLDYAVPGPQTFYVQIHRTGPNLNVRLANLYKPAGNGALVYGTNGPDSFTFQPGSTYVMTINGLSYSSTFDSRQLVQVSFDGGEGTDTVHFAGSTQWETVTIDLEAGTGQLGAGTRYLCEVTGAEVFSYTGGGGLDSVTLQATAGDDQITLGPREATVTSPGGKGASITAAATIRLDARAGSDRVVYTGATSTDRVTIEPGQATFLAEAAASDIVVFNAEHFQVDLGLGTDFIVLYGGQGPDGFEVRWDSLTGGGSAYQVSATGFEDVTVYGNPGHADFIKVYSKGGVLETFEVRPGEVTVEAGGLARRAYGFDRIEVFGNSYENDAASIYGHASVPGTLTATSTYATLSGSGYYLRAASVRQVTVYGSARDNGRFYDGPGDDRFEAQDLAAKFIYNQNPDHFVQAIGFALLTAYATPSTGGTDVAFWQGVPGQKETFYARPTEATFFGSGYRFWAVNFEIVQATGQAADGDIAYLLDSDGVDVFYYYPTPANEGEYTSLTGTTSSGWNYVNRAIGFAQTYAYSTAGGTDTAYMYDSSAGGDTFTATPSYAVMSGSGHYARAWGFERVFATARENTFVNTARLYTSNGADLFEARPTWARIQFNANPLHAVTVVGFRYTTAFRQGGAPVAYFYSVPAVDDTLTVWMETRTVVREAPGVYHRTVGFGQVYAFGNWGEADRAIVYDSPGNDHLSANGASAPRKAWVQSVDLVLELQDFSLVRAVSSAGGTDTRAVYNRALLDYVLEDLGPWIDV